MQRLAELTFVLPGSTLVLRCIMEAAARLAETATRHPVQLSRQQHLPQMVPLLLSLLQQGNQARGHVLRAGLTAPTLQAEAAVLRGLRVELAVLLHSQLKQQ